MALAPIVAAALTDHSARAKMLTIAGVDVAKQPGTPGNLFGVDMGSVVVTEAGIAGASTMTFTIDDPLSAITISDGDPVHFQDLVADRPEFEGWIQSWTVVPAFGQGRSIFVRAIGADAVLDWAYVPGFTVPDGTQFYDVILMAVAAAIGRRELRAFTDAISGGMQNGSQAFPVGTLSIAASTDPAGGIAPQTVAGGSLRETIRQIIALNYTEAGVVGPLSAIRVVVDTYFGLRIFRTHPNDWTDLTIVDTTAGAIRAEGLRHETDAAAIPRGVVVTGTGASATVFDGSGKAGAIAQLTDTTLTTAAACRLAGLSYLAGFSVSLRGTFDLTDFTPAASVHAGGQVVITDPNVGIAATTYQIGTIRKQYLAARQSWSIAYGGTRPSVVAAIRRLTRGTLS